MMTSVSLTLQLAQALGLYMIVMGLSGLTAPQRWRSMIDELEQSPALTMTMGVMVFAIGVALALSHSFLTDPLAIIVTLIGWIALIEGALLIAVPGPLLRLGRATLGITRIWAIISILLGLALGIAGLTGHIGPSHTQIFI